MKLEETILSEELMHEGNFLKFVNVTVELPDGNIGTRDIIRHPGASAILPFIDDETVILVKQFRAALNRILIELPAGKLEKDEDPLVCAKRELEEETGYKSDDIEYLGTIATGAGFTDEVIHLYKATNLYEGIKSGDEDEFIEIYKYKLDDVKKMIKNGEIIDTKTISAFMYL
ncbi:NUDIX hydrolase [uncultured Clostridium sp.]|uniref:NUDIX domain-containing protein n=1 Tax=uncultured Clostridium sp. TaxID=59620 RepID=UPI00260A6676|nr:NUDIX hydrolase [uncultured Clostridium sp.]